MKVNFLLVVFLFLISFSVLAQDTSSFQKPLHKRNIFTLGLYKQPGLDSMVDFVDGLYRVFNVNKIRSQEIKTDKLHYTFVPGIEYSLATGFASSVSASVILPYKSQQRQQHLHRLYFQICLLKKKNMWRLK